MVDLEPVLVTGDAGTQALLRRYDENQACGAEKQAAKLSCPGIALGILNTLEGGPLAGIATSLLSSVTCGKDLRALLDCQDGAASLAASAAQVVESCHARGGTVSAGESRAEIICEVER
jgi:hypothetical protein